MTYTEQDLSELKQAVPLWEIVRDYIPLTKKGKEWWGLCPFHSENTASFSILNKSGEWIYYCHGCHAKGNVFQFLQQVKNIGFREAVEKVASLTGWQKGTKKVEQTFKPFVEKNETKLVFDVSEMLPAEKALATDRAAIEWLNGRGISLQTAQKFHLGYNKSATAISPHHPLVNDGWIVFPYIENQKITLLKYRSIKEKDFLRKLGMSTTVFNLSAIEPFDDIHITEGECDAIVMEQAGFPSVSLPMAGYAVPPNIRDRLMQTNGIYLCGDSDNPGREAMTKLWTELRDRTYLVKWPEGCKDANETFLKVCEGSVEVFKQLVEDLKNKAREQPLPFVYDMRETIRGSQNQENPQDNPSRLFFPWPQIDSWVSVLPGDVMGLFASESKCGKSSWLAQILIENAIQKGKVVVNYSAELAPQQYARRAVAYLTGKDRDNLKKEHFLEAADLIGESRFYNGYKPGANWKEVIELLKWAKRRVGADILVIDPLSFLIRGDKRFQEQGEAMRALKDLAIEYNVIVIVVAQPRKAPNNQRSREATTQDAAGDYSFGTDASQVFILHRNRISETTDGQPVFESITKVTLDYAREAESKTMKLHFNGKICKFFQMDNREIMEAEA